MADLDWLEDDGRDDEGTRAAAQGDQTQTRTQIRADSDFGDDKGSGNSTARTQDARAFEQRHFNLGYREGLEAGHLSALQEGIDATFGASCEEARQQGIRHGVIGAAMLAVERMPFLWERRRTRSRGQGGGGGGGVTAAAAIPADEQWSAARLRALSDTINGDILKPAAASAVRVVEEDTATGGSGVTAWDRRRGRGTAARIIALEAEQEEEEEAGRGGDERAAAGKTTAEEEEEEEEDADGAAAEPPPAPADLTPTCRSILTAIGIEIDELAS